MCDPVTIGGALLSTAGMVANASAQDQVGSARSGVMNAELFRQGGFDREAAGVNANARDRYANTQSAADAKRKEISDFFTANGGSVPLSGPTAGATPPSSSNITVQEGEKQGKKVAAFKAQQDGALADMRSTGDVLANASRGTALDATRLGLINSFKTGSSSVLPLELNNANNAGNGTKMLGDLLGGAGQVATFAGLSGFNPFGTAGAPVNIGTPAGMATPVGARPARAFDIFRGG